ncbi:MAG: glycosyltransferase family 2 protein [Candidatus Peribacteraceae bacterium]|nr:glycosyltransferase family 2 protein [Candidatus Peribacteraceae bacterium]
MNNKLPISVHILTRNSEKTLEATLESIKDCEEILIVDGESTDNTLNIATKYGAKIINQEIRGEATDFSSIRNFAMDNTTKDWIFALDSDETANPELLSSIQKVIDEGLPVACEVTRKYVLNNGKIIDFASTYPNKRIYFFHKEVVEKWIKPVHERPQIREGTKLIKLNGACLAPIGDIEEYKRKNLRYLEIEVKKSKNKGWIHWLKHRLYHTFRSRMIGIIRLINIWLIPRKGTRLPLKQEMMRFWYGWMLVWKTCPLFNNE